MKQLNGSPEKEKHEKVTISINAQNHPETAPLGRVKWLVWEQFYAFGPPGWYLLNSPMTKLLSFFKKEWNIKTDQQKDILTE